MLSWLSNWSDAFHGFKYGRTASSNCGSSSSRISFHSSKHHRGCGDDFKKKKKSRIWSKKSESRRSVSDFTSSEIKRFTMLVMERWYSYNKILFLPLQTDWTKETTWKRGTAIALPDTRVFAACYREARLRSFVSQASKPIFLYATKAGRYC